MDEMRTKQLSDDDFRFYSEEIEVVDRVELSSDEEEGHQYTYKEVPEISDASDVSDDEDLNAALETISGKKGKRVRALILLVFF